MTPKAVLAALNAFEGALIALLCLGGFIGLSIIYRRSVQKPVLFFSVPQAEFLERTASGTCNDRWWRTIGGAHKCLVVAITRGRLVIRPFFPFTLMFLPEIFGLEYDVPVTNVISMRRDRFLFTERVRLVLRNTEGRDHRIWLFLKNPDAFVRLLPAGMDSSFCEG